MLSVAFFPNKSLTRAAVEKTEPLLSYIAWEQVRERNKALDTFVGALAMRKSLPRFSEKGLGYLITHGTVQEQIAEQSRSSP